MEKYIWKTEQAVENMGDRLVHLKDGAVS